MQLAVAMTLAAAVLLAAAAATPETAITYGYGQVPNLTTGASTYDIKRTSRVVNEELDLSHVGKRGYTASYATFMADVDFHVGATAGWRIQRHPVLGEQKLSDPPATMFNITVTADPDARVSFFLRSDNLYMMAFSNKQGTVFSFKGDRYTLPGSKSLSFGSGYRDIFRSKGHHGLLDVLVNRQMAVDHLHTLSGHQAAAPDDSLRIPVAFFILVLCESERFTPIRNAVMKRWEKQTASNIDEVLDPRTNTVLLDLVVNWRVFSCALLSWNRHGETPAAWRLSPDARDVLPRFDVTTAQGALRTVNAILQPTPRCV